MNISNSISIYTNLTDVTQQQRSRQLPQLCDRMPFGFSFMLRDDRRPHRSLGAIDWRLMQHRKEPALRAPLDRRRPGIGADSGKLGRYRFVYYTLARV